MDQKYRDNGVRTADRALSNRHDEDEGARDDLTQRREQSRQQQPPPLTSRERNERWPIG